MFSANAAEQAAITALVRAEARGDREAMVDQIRGCRARPACAVRVVQNVAALTRPGRVSIIQLQPSSDLSLTGTTGTARVVWRTQSSRPVVQCVLVRRTGDALTGLRVQLLALSARLPGDAVCPSRF